VVERSLDAAGALIAAKREFRIPVIDETAQSRLCEQYAAIKPARVKTRDGGGASDASNWVSASLSRESLSSASPVAVRRASARLMSSRRRRT